MAQKNITVAFNHPAAVSNTIRWARIDNTVSPVYTTVTGITESPYIIQNVANGQYRVYIRPVYADSRVCPETVRNTDACIGVTSLSAVVTTVEGTDYFVISYVCNLDVPYVQVTINYPNGGFSTSQYTNDGNDISIEVPANVFGTFSITMQPVCDADTGWIGASTAPVTVEVTEPSP